MKKAKIIEVKQGIYGATTENTRIPQRDKPEETMVNLAGFLGVTVVKKGRILDGSYIYSVDSDSYQSASNVILHLSRKIVGLQS